MSKSDWAATVVGILLLAAFLGALVTLVILEDAADDRDSQFAGACKILEGKVHDDLCIKDGKVVLTKKEFG